MRWLVQISYAKARLFNMVLIWLLSCWTFSWCTKVR